MRKYLFAGAVAGGLLLLGAAPADADVVSAPAGRQQDGSGVGGLLTGVDHSLGDSDVFDVTPGDNSVDLLDPAGPVLPAEDATPAARTGLGRPTDRIPAGAAGSGLRATDRRGRGLPGVGGAGLGAGLGGLLGGLPAGGGGLALAGGGLPFAGGGGLPFAGGGGLPFAGGGGLPFAGGGLPTGGGGLPFAGGGLPTGVGGVPIPGGRAATAGGPEAGLLGEDASLLGGLGGIDGLLPYSSARTLPAASGMPAGGTAVPTPAGQAAAGQAASGQAAAGRAPVTDTPEKPSAKPATADPAVAADKRLHEEPIDPVGEAGDRTFSDGRPVAGPDTEYR